MERREDFSGEVSKAEKPRQTTDIETQLAAKTASCGTQGPGNWQIIFTKKHIQAPWKMAMQDTKKIFEKA